MASGGRETMAGREDGRVLAASEAFYAAFNAKDAEAMDTVWSRSDDVGCVHPSWSLLWGRERVMESWRAILKNPDQPRIVVGGSSAYVRGDVAYVLCRELVAGSPLAATNIFMLEDGEWRMTHHHSSPVVFAGETPAGDPQPLSPDNPA